MDFLKKETKGLLILILIFAFLIRVDLLFVNKDFWHDEAFQYLYSKKPLKSIFDSNDVHPPLFNLFTKFLLKIGFDSIFWLRFLMLSISMLFIFQFFLTIKDIFNEKIALLSTTMLSFSYTFVYYSIEFRSYIFVLLFTIIQIRYFNKLLDDEPAIAPYIVFSLIMLYSHYMAGLIILVQILYFIYRYNDYNDDVKVETILGFFSTAIFSIPLGIYLLKTLPKIQSFWFNDIGIKSLISTFSYILSPPSSDLVYGFSMFYLILFGTMIFYELYKDKRYIQFLMYLFIPIIIMWTISQFYPFYHHRYFLFGGMAFFVLVAIGLEKFSEKFDNIDYFFIAVWLVLFISSFWHFSGNLNTDIRDASNFLYNYTNNATDDFVVLHSSPFSQSPMKIYLPDTKHYIMTNLTREQLFTSGGAVIEDDEIIRELSDLKTVNKDSYAVSDSIIYHHIIYSEGGLYITKID